MFKKLIKRFKNANNEQGFTLMEAVISIAFLAIIAGFVLRMFLLASDVNNKAAYVDSANYVARSAVEVFKMQDKPDDFLKNDFLKDSKITSSEGKDVVYKVYDVNFNPVSSTDFDENAKQKNIFVLKIEVSNSNVNGQSDGEIKDINVNVISHVSRDENRAPENLVNIKAKKFFMIKG